MSRDRLGMLLLPYRPIAKSSLTSQAKPLDARIHPAALRRDKDVVIEAFMQSGWALSFAFPALQEDKDTIHEAVSRQGWAL